MVDTSNFFLNTQRNIRVMSSRDIVHALSGLETVCKERSQNFPQ